MHERYRSVIIFVILVLFFLLMSLSDFGIGETPAMQNELGSIPSSLTFWRRLYRMDTISSSDVKQNYSVKSSALGVFFLRKLTTHSLKKNN